MATFFPGESHTFSEYLLVPGYSSSQCIPNNVSLKTPLTRFKRGEKPAITLNIPMAIQYFRGGYGRVELAPMMACIIIAIIPIIILYMTCQKYIIEGVVAGAVKG